MAKRLIPSQIKEESTVFRGLTFKDICILVAGLVLIALVLSSSLGTNVKTILSIVIFAIFVIAVVPFDMVRGYKLLLYWFLFLTRKRTIKEINLESVFELSFGQTIKSIGGYAAVVELHAIDFGIFDERNQDDYINAFCAAIKEVKNGKLVKLEKPLDLSRYIDYNTALIMRNLDGQEECSDAVIARNDILDNQNAHLDHVSYVDRIPAEAFYFVICDSNEETCIRTAEYVESVAKQIGLLPRVLAGRDLKLFAKLFFSPTTTEYNEKDRFQGSEKDVLQYGEIREKVNKLVVDGTDMRVMCLGKYPYFVGNAWAHDIYSLEGCRVVFNFGVYTGKNINKVLSKSMTELRSRLRDEKLREDEKLAYATSYSSLETLLEELNYANETLYYTECYLMYPANRHREILKAVRSKGIRINDLVFTQYDGWLAMLPFLPMPGRENKERYSPMQSSSIAAAFPFVSKILMDDEGSYLGFTSRYPAFFNQFELSETRVNHNMMVLGKSGGGKSFFMKKMVVRAAAEGKRIYILDPDNEYNHACDMLHGNWVDVGGETAGRINPLQVFPSLKDGGSSGDVSSHRIFLEQFFRTVCPDMPEETSMYLKKVLAELYAMREITDETNIAALTADQFPTFQTLLDLLHQKVKNENGRYDANDILVYKRLSLYIEQFAGDGVYARLWNGPTTLEIANDFNVLNFQSLFANSNHVVANGQMLLLMRFLNQEVIKNRELNRGAAGETKKVMIVIDEAHRFINPSFPVALEFMSTMGKQIRKYSGALMVATQNIDDFIGVSAEMKAQASAVINACQYSMIFGLFADDVNKVKELYSNYNGGLTQNEVDLITKAHRGEALFVVDINTRLPIHIKVFEEEIAYMEPVAQEQAQDPA